MTESPKIRPRVGSIAPGDVRQVRKELGLTQAQMAERLGLGKHGRITVANWERGTAKPGGPVLIAYWALRFLET